MKRQGAGEISIQIIRYIMNVFNSSSKSNGFLLFLLLKNILLASLLYTADLLSNREIFYIIYEDAASITAM